MAQLQGWGLVLLNILSWVLTVQPKALWSGLGNVGLNWGTDAVCDCESVPLVKTDW